MVTSTNLRLLFFAEQNRIDIFVVFFAHDPMALCALAQRIRSYWDSPGFLGVESARDTVGITVSYWRSEEDIAHWKAPNPLDGTNGLGVVGLSRMVMVWNWGIGWDTKIGWNCCYLVFVG